MTDTKQAAASAAAAKEKKTAVAQAPATVKVKRGEELVSARKIGLVGDAGAGKTHFLIAPLLAGKNIFVVSSDLGGNGLATIEGLCREYGCLDLFDEQVRGVDISSTGELLGYLYGKYDEEVTADGWQPDVEVWEGFSTYNNVTIDREIGSPKSESGKEDKYAYFREVKKRTTHPVELFFNRTINGKLPHKIITMAVDDVLEDDGFGMMKSTGRYKAMVQGKGNKIVRLGFDLVMFLYTVKGLQKLEGGKKKAITKYKYRTGGSTADFPIVKNRRFKLDDVMDADPFLVWEVLTGEKRKEQ